MGNPEFARYHLEKMLSAGFNVVAVISAPDKPGGRGSESPALKFYAKNYFDSDQLYDLNTDPKEQQNLHGDFKNSIKLYDLKKTLKSYVEQVPGTFPIDLKKPSKLKG